MSGIGMVTPTTVEPGGLETVADGLRFPEGPVAMADGSVLVVEIARQTLSRVSPSGAVEVVAHCPGGPNGAAVGPDGAIYLCNNGGRFRFVERGDLLLPVGVGDDWEGGSIQRVDVETGSVETLYDSCDGRRLRAPNDLVFDSHGGFWFTDFGVRHERSIDRTAVYYAKADGSAITEAIFPLVTPNGVALSPSEDRVYVAETDTGRCWSWPLEGPGVIGERHRAAEHGGWIHIGLPDAHHFDSMAVDGDGWACIATIGAGGITAVAPDRSAIEFHPLPDRMTTNICFGGEGLRTAYATLSSTGRLVSFRWPRPGLTLPNT